MRLVRMLVPVVFFLTQSPLAYSSTGGAISPLQVIVSYLKEEMKGQPQSHGLMKVTRAAVFPGNLIRAALVSAPFNTTSGAPKIDVADLWERGIDLATQRTASYKAAQHHELLLTGSFCCIIGALLSLALFRVHVLLLFGVAMLGSFFGLNGLTPTVQYALCIALPVWQMTSSSSSKQGPVNPKLAGGHKAKTPAGKAD
eukprot:scaffold12812_cov138-Isochrysis_galbana.AAC.1